MSSPFTLLHDSVLILNKMCLALQKMRSMLSPYPLDAVHQPKIIFPRGTFYRLRHSCPNMSPTFTATAHGLLTAPLRLLAVQSLWVLPRPHRAPSRGSRHPRPSAASRIPHLPCNVFPPDIANDEGRRRAVEAEEAA